MPDAQATKEAVEALLARWSEFFEKLVKPARCVYCDGARVEWKDRKRTRGASVVVVEDVVHFPDIPCPRVKCGECPRSWTLRPSEIVPHKHYQPCVVARAVAQYLFEDGATQEEVARRHRCSRRTVGRWLEWTAELADPAVLLGKVLDAVDAPLRPSLSLVTRWLEQARPLVRRAAEVLGLLEDLGSAWGLEPPGLRAVLRRTVGDRSGVATYARPLVPELARGPPA